MKILKGRNDKERKHDKKEKSKINKKESGDDGICILICMEALILGGYKEIKEMMSTVVDTDTGI